MLDEAENMQPDLLLLGKLGSLEGGEDESEDTKECQEETIFIGTSL